MASPFRSHSADRTRSMLVNDIRAAGRISRVELARNSGMNEATISKVVRRLIDDGLVVEHGFSESTGGKRPTLLNLNSESRHAVGISLDHERLTFVVTDLSGHLVGRLTSAGTGDDDPDSVIERIAAEVQLLLDSVQIDRATVVGIGIASPGPLDSSAGALRGRQPTPAWRDYPLRDRLEARSEMLVALDNDATCAAVHEYWTSKQADSAPVSAAVYMADGIGCGILIDGIIFHGMSSNAGELGHITLDVNGPVCPCGSRGCVELYASPAAVVARALRNPKLVRELELDVSDDGVRSNFRLLARAATRGHEPSNILLSEAATYLGAAMTTLSNLLDLDEVHLSGPGFADAGAIFAKVIQKQLNERTFMRAVHPVRVKVSHVGTEAAALGAAALVLQHEITPHIAVASRRQ